MDLAETLSAAGAQIIGPAGTIENAFELLRPVRNSTSRCSMSKSKASFIFDVADELVKRDVPIIFTTGYERSEIPPRFHAARHCEKPVGIAAIARALSEELARGAQLGVRLNPDPQRN